MPQPADPVDQPGEPQQGPEILGGRKRHGGRGPAADRRGALTEDCPAARAGRRASGGSTSVPVNSDATPKMTARLPRIGGCHGTDGAAMVVTVMIGACGCTGSTGASDVTGGPVGGAAAFGSGMT